MIDLSSLHEFAGVFLIPQADPKTETLPDNLQEQVDRLAKNYEDTELAKLQLHACETSLRRVYSIN